MNTYTIWTSITGYKDMGNLVYLFSCFLSCTVIVSLMSQFWNDRYEKTFENPVIYKIVTVAAIAVLTLVNLINSVVWNGIATVLVFGIISFSLYESDRKWRRVLESECFFWIIGLFDSISIWGIASLMNCFDVVPKNLLIKSSVEVVCSKPFLIFFYHILLRQFWKKDYRRSWLQYLFYFTMLEYGIGGTIVSVFMASRGTDYFLLCINLSCIVFVNIYLFYFMKMRDEKNELEFQIAMMKQQESMQFEHYERQREKYGKSIEVLHDVSKHLRSIEELYKAGMTDKAMEYTRQIGGILKPLVPEEYSDNPMLNILLADRKQAAESMGIRFVVKVESTGLGFIEPVDVTTLFGNLLENAMQAVLKCSGERYIKVHIRNYNEMLSIRIENSVEKEVRIKNGKPVSTGGKGTGIGCLNVERCVEKYGGSVLYKNDGGKFYSDVILNR